MSTINTSSVRGSSDHKGTQSAVKAADAAIKEAIKAESVTLEQLKAQQKALREKLKQFKASAKFPVGSYAFTADGQEGLVCISGLSHCWLYFAKGLDGKSAASSDRFNADTLSAKAAQ